MVHTATPDIEPSAEFNAYCIDVVQRWELGNLPFKEAMAYLTLKEQEAITQNHLANQARAHHMLGYLQHYRGNLNESIRHYEKARNLYEKVGNQRLTCMTDLNNGENYRLKGDFARARRLYHSAYDLAGNLGNISLQTMSALNEGLALLAIGQMGSAYKLLMEALELSKQWTERPDRLSGLLCELYHGLTTIFLSEGKIEDAWQSAQKAYEFAHSSEDRKLTGFAYRAMGEVITEVDVPEDADYSSDPDDYFRQALEVFRDLNMEAEMARTIFAQARSLAKRGRRTTAARKLQQVMIMFTDLGMMDDTAKAAEEQLAVM